MKVLIIGAGYVGLNCAVAFAFVGHDVVLIEKDDNKLAMLRCWQSPIHEHGLQELLQMPAVQQRLVVCNNMELVSEADIVMIAVGTPTMENGHADNSYVENCTAELATHLSPTKRQTVVVKSTVPIGTHRRVRTIISRELEKRGLTRDVHTASNPEFLREGSALSDMLYPDRVVIGCETQSDSDMLYGLYRPILEQSFEPPLVLPRSQNYMHPPLIMTSATSAEMIKYASNCFLATKISYINEIAQLCEKLGADVTEVARGMGLDTRIGPAFLNAGIGWGGSCFPKDTKAMLAMAQEHDLSMPLIQAAVEVNKRMRMVIVEKLQIALKGLRGRTIGVMGLTFKPGTDDVRESPAVELVELLLERGAYVKAHDPKGIQNFRHAYPHLDVMLCSSPTQCALNTDAVVIATDWSEYKQLDWGFYNGVFIDARNSMRNISAHGVLAHSDGG